MAMIQSFPDDTVGFKFDFEMPSPPCTQCVPEYIQELDKFPSLRQNGFSFLVDASGKLFVSVKPSLKDVETNIEAGRFGA